KYIKTKTMGTKKERSLFNGGLMKEAIQQSFIKLNPKMQFRNPVRFTVEIGTIVMLVVCVWVLMGAQEQGSFSYNFIVFLVLLFTLLFASFAEALAEARGKAQAASL